MEYEYINDPITGTAKANFSLEHEIIGPWLEVEVGSDSKKLAQLLTAIDDVELNKQAEVFITGREYSATISRDDVTIQANASLNGSEAPIPEALSSDVDNIDAGHITTCGVEDFRQALLSWAQFIRT